YNLDTLVPCQAGDGTERGTITSVSIGGGSGTMQRYTGGVESVFATMFDGENCEPGTSRSTGTSLDHYYRRGDLARMLLIYEEARHGAAGLALEADPYTPVTAGTIQQ